MEIPPSPVPCRAPARAQPLLSASMACPLSEPKLMPDTFTTDEGRNAFARPPGPPSTLAHGSGRAGSGCMGSSGGPATGKVTCLTIV